MIDANLLRVEPELVAEKLAQRGVNVDIKTFQDLESQRKTAQTQLEELQAYRNKTSKQIGQAKAKGEDATQLMQQVGSIGEQLKSLDISLKDTLSQMNALLSELPNIAHASVPQGKEERDNREERKVGAVPEFDFKVKDHVALGEALGMLDFESAGQLAGSRFVVMKQDMVRLHRALIHFMIDLHRDEHGYEEVYVPYMVNSEILYGTGQLPKFEEDLYKLSDQHYLIPTAEVPVTNLVREQIVKQDKLPLRYVCHTPCFRSEAGSYGRDTRGILRQHQFEKVELVHIAHPDNSYEELERLVGCAETVLQRLQLPYRVITLCTGDMGFAAAKTYDIEVWLPGQQTYREISSCSNCEDFQARRMKARFKNSKTGKNDLVHTLNGSGLAIGRTLIAVLENYQNEDGSINVPEALVSYMGGQTIISA